MSLQGSQFKQSDLNNFPNAFKYNCKTIPLQSVSIWNAIMLLSKLLFPSTRIYRLKCSLYQTNQFQSIENSHQRGNCNLALLFRPKSSPTPHKSPAQWDYNIKRHFNCHWNIICSVCTSTTVLPPPPPTRDAIIGNWINVLPSILPTSPPRPFAKPH